MILERATYNHIWKYVMKLEIIMKIAKGKWLYEVKLLMKWPWKASSDHRPSNEN